MVTAFDIFLSAPVLVKVLGSLAFILVLNRFCRQLVVSLGAGALLLAVWTGHPPAAIARISWQRFSSVNNICLMIIVFQVIWLSCQMSETGVMRDLVAAVRARIKHRTALAALPAIIGMLPMPGGAIFSAPLVDDCDHDKSIPPLLKTEINYWFRHVWEYWWPLYPGVLLAIEIADLPIWQFMVVQFPLSVLSVVAGWFLLLRRVETPGEDGDGMWSGGRRFSIPKLLAPVLAVIGVYTAIRVAFPATMDVSRYLPMILGLIVGIGTLQIQRPLKLETWRAMLLSRKTFTLAVVVAVVRIYGAFIEGHLPGGDILLVEQMGRELALWHVPVVAIIMLLPFVSGLASGLAVGFVGASFPIVFSLIGTDPSPGLVLATLILAYGFGYMGMILSPVHVCLVVTNEHFKTRVVNSIREMVPPACVVLAGVLLYYGILHLILI